MWYKSIYSEKEMKNIYIQPFLFFFFLLCFWLCIYISLYRSINVKIPLFFIFSFCMKRILHDVYCVHIFFSLFFSLPYTSKYIRILVYTKKKKKYVIINGYNVWYNHIARVTACKWNNGKKRRRRRSEIIFACHSLIFFLLNHFQFIYLIFFFCTRIVGV